jgi:acyl carrier protein
MNTREALAWIAEVLEESPDRLAEDTPREHIPTWDSLGLLTLMAALDEKFDIQLSEEEMEGMTSIGDILAILRRDGAVDG